MLISFLLTEKSGQDPAWEKFLMTLFLTLPNEFLRHPQNMQLHLPVIKKTNCYGNRFHQTLSPFPEGFL